jgi:geranylgeranyl diphosphate synthase type II
MIEVLADYQRRVEEHLDACLDSASIPSRLLEAMRYAVFNGGKRIRPALVYMAAEALGAALSRADSTACAIEMIHAYSLIHDDLPSMDDDDLRRGQPTCHIKFDEATAILAGDALHSLAFEIVARDPALAAGTRVELIGRISAAAGPTGMVGGQVIDLQSENRTVDDATLEHMHRSKTGALLSASVVCGGIIADAPPVLADALARYGYALGLAFQVRDDILDEIGDTEVIGKRTGADHARRKTTFVSVHGLDSAGARLDELRLEAIDALAPLGETGAGLRQLADFVARRDH